MSGSHALAAPPQAAPIPERASRRLWMLAPYALPLHMLRIWGRCLPALVLWFAVGKLGRFGLLVAGSEFSHGSGREWRLAGVMLIFIVMVMLAMVVTVGMLYALRAALYEVRARRAEGEDDEPFTSGLGRVIIVFVAIYLAWGWHIADVREFANADMERYADQYDKYVAALLATGFKENQGKELAKPVPPDAGANLVMDVKIALIFVIVAFIARYIVSFIYDRKGGRGLAFGVAFCELAFTFYGASVIVTFTDERTEWVSTRVVAQWWNDTWATLESSLPGWQTVMEWLADVRPMFMDAIVAPLTWLTLAILVYGAYSEDARALIRGTRLEDATSLVEERTHTLTRRGIGMLVTRWGWDKWPPLLHALRLTLRAGAPLFAVMCLCYALLRVGADYAERGVYYLIGPVTRQLDWELYQIPVHFGRELLFTTLSLCLFAATFDLAATRHRLNRSVSSGA